MKSIVVFLLTVLLLLFTISFPALAIENLPVYLDDRQIPCDVPPIMVNDRTMVPVRVISEALGADVNWQDNVVLIEKAGNELKLTLETNIAYKNGVAMEKLESAPFIYHNRTMVPLRFIAEAFSLTVDYSSGKVLLNRPAVSAQDKSSFFDLAIARHFDQLPELTETHTPSLGELLMYIHSNMENSQVSDTNDMITKEQVDKVAKEQFGVENLKHQSNKEWRLTGDIYIATGWSWYYGDFFDLREINRYREGSNDIVEILLDQYSFDEYSLEGEEFIPDFSQTYSDPTMYVLEKKENEIKNGLSFTDAVKDMIITGDTNPFHYVDSLRIKYYLDKESGNMVFTYIHDSRY